MTAANNEHRIAGPRLIAIVGPFQSGKTSLLEGILARGGGLARQGAVRDGTTVGDSSQEARSHAMSVEPNVASIDYMGDRLTFFDCPGSIEFIHDMRPALPVCDAAIVVCEADPRKIPALQVILRELEELGLPRILFLNKIDQAGGSLRETLEMLQPASRTPLLLRQIPVWENGVATGFVDLALERAFLYRESAPSEVIEMPAGVMQEEKHARYSMLEKLADYDDALMEQLLSDLDPPKDLVFDDLARELREGQVVPVLIGSATEGHGVTRLLKAVRHEAPGIGHTRLRLGVDDSGPALAQVIRTVHTAHGGKLSLSRVLRGAFGDGVTVINSRGIEERIGGLARLTGSSSAKIGRAEEGDTVAFARLENLATGDRFAEGKTAPAPADLPPAPPPTQAFAIKVKDRKDEVRLAAALAKLCEEDPALSFVQDAEMSEMKLLGQGEMHLRVTQERLSDRFGVTIHTHKPTVAYRETIRDKVTVRGRHKKQSGGHGQFGDVVVEVGPRARGEGFAFDETVHGGSVPRQYFSSVEAGARDATARGPLGFPVVDIAVTLTDGSYHTVDSSDMAFRAAARIALDEAMAKARPVLLEPILSVTIYVPSDALARASALVSARRGQILGFEGREGWKGWEALRALIPEAEIGDLIIELRSATSGVGAFETKFDHLAELTGKTADHVVEQRRAANANG
ncbi:translation elongation factor 2 (EF-2/EF-G) [Roseiarcus fermentans]|uniref:Elongation factor G n=1 Tax=Roseiarcus fermentans TaxID=1473586 RepID=A0A366FWY9_9HYPH|nr:elongation factor G [Roseiarcus fermentans]RBP18255.1 translation elongation factor 2 (EF-2/EF-G) [Roseiarcus fermentans]